MIVRLHYVECDQCGDPAVPPLMGRATDKGARSQARDEGFRRHEITAGPLAGLTLDLCPACASKAGLK